MAQISQISQISLISYLSCIVSRLTYFNNDNFVEKYTRIFDIKELSTQLPKIKRISEVDLFTPKVSNLIPISKQINVINYKNVKGKNIKSIGSSANMKYIIISTSNYSSVYLIADKRTNTIFIAFRGTSSVKSGLSYLKLTSLLPFRPCNKTQDGYLLGMFKIVGEIFYTISEGIRFLSDHFLKTNKIKLITTGHSLGGGCAQIFSYLWIKHNPSSNICCTTFGSPRSMNGPLIAKYITLISKHKIQFERIITDGDPIAKLSPKTVGLTKSRTYYHVDDYNSNLKRVALFCTNYNKTKKVQCGLKNKTLRSKIDHANHGTYLAINYAKAAQGLTNMKKEIHRDKHLNTICRIIIGGANTPSRVTFFNLQKLKTPNSSVVKNVTMKLSKKLLTDYKHQDIYMNLNTFNTIIKESTTLDTSNLNPLETDTYVNLDNYINKPNRSLVC